MASDLARKLYETAAGMAGPVLQPWDRVDPAHQASWERIAATAEHELDAVPSAQRDQALLVLARVVAILRRQGGYMTSEDQATMRGARALLAEHGMGVP